MTTIQLLGLKSRSFAPISVELSTGLWVILTDRECVADEFSRLLVGLDRPRRGNLLIDGQSPRSCPTRRKSIASLLAREQLCFSETTEGAVAAIAALRGVSLDAISVLKLLTIEALATRDTRSLTSNESRQVATALALSQLDAKAAVFFEPLVALNQTQISQFQHQLSTLARQACVLCVTSSMHDARLLGGPHAQLTSGGWTAFKGDLVGSPLQHVYVEGPNLRQLTSEVALLFPITRLSLQTRNQTQDSLEIVGASSNLSTSKIVGIARRTRTSISRMFAEGMGTAPIQGDAQQLMTELGRGDTNKTNSGLSLSALTIGGRSQWHLTSKVLASVMGCAALLGEPSVAAIYASLQRFGANSWTSYEALVFLGTVLAPLWALILCRLMYADSALGSGVEVLARYGAKRRILALNRLLTVSLLNGALGAISSVLMLVCISSGWAAPAHGELVLASWIVGLGGAVYGAIVVALTDATRSHLSRWAFILLDFLMGGTSRAISFPFPRAHLHNLLGSATAIEFSQRGSCIILGLLLFLAVGLTMLRTDP